MPASNAVRFASGSPRFASTRLLRSNVVDTLATHILLQFPPMAVVWCRVMSRLPPVARGIDERCHPATNHKDTLVLESR